jgi:hypothetical protein
MAYVNFKLDTDADGSNNFDEIVSGSLPGDAKSKPSATGNPCAGNWRGVAFIRNQKTVLKSSRPSAKSAWGTQRLSSPIH